MAESKLDGSCLCGAVRVTATPLGDSMHVCHCDMCRAWTGTALMSFKADPGTFEATGPVRKRATSDWAERAWCDECGSSLYYRVTAPGPHFDMHHVASGLFADAGGLTLNNELFVDKRPGGYRFAGDLPGMTQAEVEALFGGDG